MACKKYGQVMTISKVTGKGLESGYDYDNIKHKSVKCELLSEITVKLLY